MVPDFFRSEGAVEQEGAAVSRALQYVELFEEAVDMAGHEVRLVDEVARVNGVRTKTQMADGDAAGLLGVVAVVALRIEVGEPADDLDGVLVGAHGAVGAESVEEAADGLRIFGVEGRVVVEAGEADVVVDADGEAVFGSRFLEFVEDAFDHGGGEVFAGESVAAAHDGDVGAVQGFAHVVAERLTDGCRIFAAVEDRDALDRGRQRAEESGDVEGTEEVDGEDADFFAVLEQARDCLMRYCCAGAHDDDDSFGVVGSVVVEEVVLAAELLREAVHGPLGDVGSSFVVGRSAFAGLEEDVGVLGGAAHDGGVGAEPVVSVVAHEVVVDEGPHVVVGDEFDLHLFVAGAEAVEEVDDGHAAFKGGHLGDQGHVFGFLHGRGGEHGPACVAHCHDVGVVSEDGEAVGGQGPGGDVHDGAREFAGDLEHVGDHEEQSLRGREGGAKGTRLDRAVVGGGGAGFALHLLHERDGAPDVGTLFSRPLVRPFAHRRRRRDRINGDYLVYCMGHVGDCFIAVQRDHRSVCH